LNQRLLRRAQYAHYAKSLLPLLLPKEERVGERRAILLTNQRHRYKFFSPSREE